FAEVEVVDHDKGNLVISKLLNFKSAFMDNLEKVIAEPAVGLGEGLLLGVKQALGDELEEAFRKTGIIHIVVLSGYNIMLVVAFVMLVLGYFLSRRWRTVFGILAIISFALLVGLSATVVRASIMASLLLIAQATGRIYLVLRALLVAGFIMLLFNPLLLVYDVGFQLSFMATLGLILLTPQLERLFTKIPNLAGARMFLTATIATQIAVLPLLLYQIGQFSVVSVLVNLLVLPMVPVAMLLTFITGMLGFVSMKLT
ncbi:ComEC/Rec2 family competence protein, partial [Candidatus Nomurabacteria bacterium]|nr:ComEC/Rec2 family competence protein [Candidatus Nomurabacteria bacterium]